MCLLDLAMPVYPAGQQFVVLRPSIKYFVSGTNEQEEKSTRTGWVFAQWTEDMALAAQLDAHILFLECCYCTILLSSSYQSMNSNQLMNCA